MTKYKDVLLAKEMKEGKKTTNQLLEEILVELKKANKEVISGQISIYPQFTPNTTNLNICPYCKQLTTTNSIHNCGGGIRLL